MIGRFAGTARLADVSLKSVVMVVAAAVLLVAAVAVKYLAHTPEAVVIGLSLGSLCLTGFPIIWGAVRGLLRLTTNVDELVGIAILASMFLGVSIASRENTVALETADVVLMQDGLGALPFLLRMSKATTRTINQNLLLFGLMFNAAMLTLSGFGVLTPIMGAIGHNIGSVAVVLNSARLLRL